MLPLQTTPLPHEVQYILDSALEVDDLNGFDHLMLTLFADRSGLSELLDNWHKQPHPGGWAKRTGAMCLELDRLAHTLADQLEVSDQKSLVAASLLREDPRLTRLAECHAGWNYTDSTIGGDLKKFKRRVRLDKKYEPAGQIKRRLYDQRSISHYVREVDCSSTEHSQMLSTSIRLRRPWPDSPSEADGLQHYFAEQSERYREAYARAVREFDHKASRKHKRRLQQQRRAVVRSASAAETILGRGQVMTLARGEPVFIEGSELTFRVAVRDLMRCTHGALDVSLQTHNGTRLADTCLYFDGTPALEQAAAISLHVQAGEELDLLLAGNLSNISTIGAAHPLIADRLKQRHEELVNFHDTETDGAGLPVRRPARYNRHVVSEITRMRRDVYIAEMMPHYLEPLIDRVWGDAAGRLRAFTSQVVVA